MTDIDRALDLLRSANPVVTVDDLDGGELAASVAACERVLDDAAHAELGGVAVVAGPVQPQSRTIIPSVRPVLVPAALFAIVVMAVATVLFGSTLLDEPAATDDLPTPTSVATTVPPTSTTVIEGGAPYDVAVDFGLVYWSDGDTTLTVHAYYPTEGQGPWPVVVAFPHYAGGATDQTTARAMAERGAVAFAPVTVRSPAYGDPAEYVDGFHFDRGACAVGFAQANAERYGGDPSRTTVIGSGGGDHQAVWAALGLVRNDMCEEPIRHAPIGLIAGQPQWLFEVDYWDETITDPTSNALDTIDRFLNPERWSPSDRLRAHIWVTSSPYNERAVDDSAFDDSWIALRDTTGDLEDDLLAVGAFDDGYVRFDDNARLMYLRMRRAGIAVTLDQSASDTSQAKVMQYDRMWAIVAGG